MLKVAKAVGIGVIALFVAIASSLLGGLVAHATFAVFGMWSVAGFMILVVTGVGLVAYIADDSP